MDSRKAFSLAETLLVVATVAILMVLMLPILSLAREAALDARSLGNLRQIGGALMAFVAENNGYLMPRAYASSAATPKGQSRFWTATLFNKGYLPERKVFYDPRFPPYGPDEAASSQRLESGTPATYGMRDWVPPGAAIGTSTVRVAKPVSLVKEPGAFFIVADSYWKAWRTQGYGISPGVEGENCVRLDKKGKAGALFLDGHVTSVSREYFESLVDSQGEYSNGLPIPVWSPEMP